MWVVWQVLAVKVRIGGINKGLNIFHGNSKRAGHDMNSGGRLHC